MKSSDSPVCQPLQKGLALSAAFTFLTWGAYAQIPKSTMNNFVLIFRQHPGQLSEADLKLRTELVRKWAVDENAKGHHLDPHIVGKEGFYLSADRKLNPVVSGDDGPVTALLFIEAEDLDSAVEIAKGHPGLSFGATVEVRPWSPPAPVSP